MRQTPLPTAARAADADAPARRTRPEGLALLLLPPACVVLALAFALAPHASSQAPAETPDPAATQSPNPDATQSPNPDATQSPNPAATQSPAATPTPTATPTPEVMFAYRREQEWKVKDPEKPGQLNPDPRSVEAGMTAGLDDIVVLEVSHLKRLLLRSKCLREEEKEVEDAATKVKKKVTEVVEIGDPCKPQDILLFVEGRPLKGLQPESGAPELTDGENGTLRYHLQRPPAGDKNYDDAKEHWADLLGLGWNDIPSPWTRPVSVSVGLENEYPIPSRVDDKHASKIGRFNLQRVRGWRFLFWVGLLVVFGYYFWKLARHGDIIRDRKPIAWLPGNTQRKPYSLSRTQIAWWTFFIVFGFIFIWLVTGQHDLSQTALLLLGVSVATVAGAAVIEQNRTTTPRTQGAANAGALTKLLQEKERLEGELNKLEADVAAGLATAADLSAKKAAYDEHITKIREKFPDALGWNCEGIGRDILSDSSGVNIHRFQMVVWTVVLGFIFIHEVFTRLAMPEFTVTLLALLGISNGSYLLGKTAEPANAPPEQQATEEAADEAADEDDGDDADGDDAGGGGGDDAGGGGGDEGDIGSPPEEVP